MFVVDTNVLVHAADADSVLHRRCRNLLEAWCASPDAWFVTWGILYEFVRVMTHPRVMRRPLTSPDAWSFVKGLLEAPGLQALVETERHPAVLEQLLSELPHLSGNIVHDAHTAALMREHGIRRIYTRDTDFHRFRFLEVVDPIEPAVHEPAPRKPKTGARRG